MSEMVERVAKAIRVANSGEYTSQAQAEMMARAAIKAMREPTDAMRNAFSDDFTEWLHENIPDEMHLYKAMIDAALSG